MPKPTVGSFTQDWADQLDPLTFDETSQDYALLKFLAASGERLQEIDDYVRDSDAGPGWSSLMDVDRAPENALPWLGQMLGAILPLGLTDQQKRDYIKAKPGWHRGSPQSIKDVIATYLVGTKYVGLLERDTSPYHFAVHTNDSETPKVGKQASTTMTISGNEITDAKRLQGIQGDGRPYPDSSIGIWDASTNLIYPSGFEGGVGGWSIGGGSSLVQDSSRRLFGSYAGLWTMAASFSSIQSPNASAPVPAAGDVYTASIWVYAEGSAIGKRIAFLCTEVGGAGGSGTTTVEYTLVAGWQRLTATRTVVSSDRTAVTSMLYQEVSSGTKLAAGEYIWIEGVQIERKNHATPYIATTTAQATRSVSAVSAPSSLLDTQTSWVAMRVRMGAPAAAFEGSARRLFSWSSATLDNNIQLNFGTGSAGLLQCQKVTPFRVDSAVIGTTPWATGDYLTLVLAWTPFGVKISVNGSAFTTINPGTNIPTSMRSVFDIGSMFGSTLYQADCDFLWLACGKGNVASTDPAVLHAFGNSDPDLSQFPTSMRVTAVFPMSVPTDPVATTAAYQDVDPTASIAAIKKAIDTQKPAGTQYTYTLDPS